MRVMWRALLGLAAWVGIAKLLTCFDGATDEERRRPYPGDELVEPKGRSSTMAATIAAPPWAIWPWLVQMGRDRAGFYSWDRIDNGSRPSSTEIRAEWQMLVVGDHVTVVPDHRVWWEVAHLEHERALVLEMRFDYGSKRTVPAGEPNPTLYGYGIWSFMLEPSEDGASTRLIIRVAGHHRPRVLAPSIELVFWELFNWFMTGRQLRNLRLRAEELARRAEAEQPVPLVASLR
jgi:hypothetical protein